MTRDYSWTSIFVAAGVAVLTAGAGALLTELGPWYYDLKKPSWQPPDWAFGPAWTTIFALGAASAVLAWGGAETSAERTRVVVLFGVNVLLNSLWSFLFFRRRRPDHAFVEVIPFWLSIVALMAGVWPLSRTASLLLVPYLLWVSFASYLNLTIVRLNGSFPRG